MRQPLPKSITVNAGHTGSHLQGIAIDKNREYLYLSFTTCLLKADLQGHVVGSVSGLVGHMGCIAYNGQDGMVYGSLEFKHDSIGKDILGNLGYREDIKDGFYAVRFDVDKITRMDMNAEKDGVMTAVFLKEVYDDYSAPGHRHGCSGIDGITFAPSFEEDGKQCLYIAYGVYGDTARDDNDYQVILKYDLSGWDRLALPLNQLDMHRNGPEKPDGKYFVYTGNTTYGIQNLEYDGFSDTMIAAVYRGHKEQFPNYPMFFIDCSKKPRWEALKGVGQDGLVLSLTDFREGTGTGIVGSDFPHGSTGIAGLGDGLFYIAQSFENAGGHGGVIRLYRLNRENLTFDIVT